MSNSKLEAILRQYFTGEQYDPVQGTFIRIPFDKQMLEATQAIQALIDTETTQARYEELADLNYAIAKNNWYGDKQHKMFVYIADRFYFLGADNAGNDLVATDLGQEKPLKSAPNPTSKEAK